MRALCRKGGRSSAEKPEGGKTAAYVREHCLDGDISLSSTAEALGISTKQVSRLLRMEVDMTFKEYLLHLRMSAAQDFLREEGLSIAGDCGPGRLFQHFPLYQVLQGLYRHDPRRMEKAFVRADDGIKKRPFFGNALLRRKGIFAWSFDLVYSCCSIHSIKSPSPW